VPEVEAVFSVAGFSFAGSAPNQGLIFAKLKEFDQRPGDEHRLPAILARLRGQLFGIQNAFVIPFAPPAIQGLGQFGGFTFEVLDQGGATNIQNLAGATFGIVGRRSAVAAGDRALQHIYRERSAACRRHRSREGPKPRSADQRDHQRDADLSRIRIRQRLRLQQPRVSRVRAGRQAIPSGSEGAWAVLRAHQ
jgi:hypothetical protein